MSKHIIAAVDEIPVGGRKVVEIKGRSIGVFNVNGALGTFKSRTRHQND